MSSYPSETVLFFKREKDPFANPITHQLNRGLTDILTVLVQDQGPEAALAAIDEVIRVMALRNLNPSQALAFVFQLKPIMRQELAQELEDSALALELVELESRIDGLALLGFDSYMQRREKLCEIKVKEVKSRVSGLLRRAGIEADNL